jgi:hypothetical protein
MPLTRIADAIRPLPAYAGRGETGGRISFEIAI